METEVGIPWAQVLKSILACALVVLLLALDVVIIGPLLLGMIACALCAILCIVAFIRNHVTMTRVLLFVALIVVGFTSYVWYNQGANIVRAWWPVPQCVIHEDLPALQCEYVDETGDVVDETHPDATEICQPSGVEKRWFVCDGVPLFRVRALTSRFWAITQWVRWLMLPTSFMAKGILVSFVVTTLYDMFTKNDNRRPGEHHSPYWWDFIFRPVMRKAAIVAWMKSVEVTREDLSTKVRVDFNVRNGKKQESVYGLELTDEQWDDLRSLAMRRGSFSASGLADVGFSSGPNGMARKVSESLKEAQVLTMEGRRLVATEQFTQALIDYFWRKDNIPPTPDDT
jgi:hypothetical protein